MSVDDIAREEEEAVEAVAENVPTLDEEVAQAAAEDEQMDTTGEGEPQGFPMPPVEIILHNAVTDIKHIPTPQGVMTLARFVTPAFCFTLKLDERGKNGVIRDLLADPVSETGLLVPKPGIVLPDGVKP